MIMTSTLLTGVKAFGKNRSLLQKSSVAAFSRTLTARQMSDAMPHGDDKMPFYALGVNLANQLGKNQLGNLLSDDEMDIVIDGFTATMKETSLVDGQAVLMKYGMELNQILTKRTGEISEKIAQDGKDFITNFLDCNEEAIQTDSGLVYYSMVEGTGAQPTIADTVEVHYHGTLIDGTVFDSSVDRGQTISFPLGNVIKGWQEGLAMMKEGGKATLVIPSDLAYGEAGTGDSIPGGATLKFEVELFKVNP